MASNGEWGHLAEHDPAMAAALDKCEDLPPPGVSVPLEAFLATKNLSRIGLLRLGARMKNETTLAFPYEQGIKYRDMVSGKRHNFKGSKFDGLKVVKSPRSHPEGIIVVEGETDAARVALLYEEMDVGILGAGARHFTQAMADRLGTYDLVLVGLDSDEAGEAGAKKILERVDGAVRFAPPDGKKDWCEVEDGEDIPDVPAAVSDPNDVIVGTLTFPSMLAALDLDLAPPDQLVDNFIYTEGIHVFDGHPGCGKTSFLMSCARDVMEIGWDVVWLDHESGIRQALRKLLATGVATNLIVDKFHYTPFPKKAEDQLHDIVDRWPKALIVVDSISKALATAGLNENDNSEVTSFTVKLIEAAKRRRVPMALIDHVAKNSKDSMYSRGAGAKLADTDVQWRVTKMEDFNMQMAGLVSFRQDKDREGILPFEQWATVGGDDGLDFKPCANPDLEDAPPPPTEGAEDPKL